MVHDLFEAVGVGGRVLVVAGFVMILKAWGSMDESMATQAPPRRFARDPSWPGPCCWRSQPVGLIIPD